MTNDLDRNLNRNNLNVWGGKLEKFDMIWNDLKFYRALVSQMANMLLVDQTIDWSTNV